jgi:hypothetical protein
MRSIGPAGLAPGPVFRHCLRGAFRRSRYIWARSRPFWARLLTSGSFGLRLPGTFVRGLPRSPMRPIGRDTTSRVVNSASDAQFIEVSRLCRRGRMFVEVAIVTDRYYDALTAFVGVFRRICRTADPILRSPCRAVGVADDTAHIATRTAIAFDFACLIARRLRGGAPARPSTRRCRPIPLVCLALLSLPLALRMAALLDRSSARALLLLASTAILLTPTSFRLCCTPDRSWIAAVTAHMRPRLMPVGRPALLRARFTRRSRSTGLPFLPSHLARRGSFPPVRH